MREITRASLGGLQPQVLPPGRYQLRVDHVAALGPMRPVLDVVRVQPRRGYRLLRAGDRGAPPGKADIAHARAGEARRPPPSSAEVLVQSGVVAAADAFIGGIDLLRLPASTRQPSYLQYRGSVAAGEAVEFVINHRSPFVVLGGARGGRFPDRGLQRPGSACCVQRRSGGDRAGARAGLLPADRGPLLRRAAAVALGRSAARAAAAREGAGAAATKAGGGIQPAAVAMALPADLARRADHRGDRERGSRPAAERPSDPPRGASHNGQQDGSRPRADRSRDRRSGPAALCRNRLRARARTGTPWARRAGSSRASRTMISMPLMSRSAKSCWSR